MRLIKALLFCQTLSLCSCQTILYPFLYNRTCCTYFYTIQRIEISRDPHSTSRHQTVVSAFRDEIRLDGILGDPGDTIQLELPCKRFR